MGASGFLLAVLDKCTKPPHNNLKVSLVLSFSSLSYSSDGDAPIANLKRQTRRPAIASDEPSDDKEDKTLSELAKQCRHSVSSAHSYQEEEEEEGAGVGAAAARTYLTWGAKAGGSSG